MPPSAHIDTFAKDRLPPKDQWPDLVFDLPRLKYPDILNCGAALLDEVAREAPDRIAIIQGPRVWTYRRLAETTNRYAHTLVDNLAVRPGTRVLLRGANTPELFACWLAVVKVGAIAVTTMPLLRTVELRQIAEKVQIEIALCEGGLCDELVPLVGSSTLKRLAPFGPKDGFLDRLSAGKPTSFEAVETRQDDVCLIAFTSGTTGEPKAAAHFHRDVMAMCDTFAAHMLDAGPDAVFTGTPPIAFTFGLGALLAFPLYFRCAVALPELSSPAGVGETVAASRATHLFTSPTAYRALMAAPFGDDLSSLRVCVAAGEQLPLHVSNAWFDATGIRIVDGIGATEMIHIFISAAGEDIRPGAVGKPVPGYTACLLDDAGNCLDGPSTGRLAVRGPTGCRYLDDARQTAYVINGWNVTGDVFRRDEDGYYWFVARADDMIVSSGYNIAGPEVEAALLQHPAVLECGVVGWRDAQRGNIVKAFVVLAAGHDPSPELARSLQDHVKDVLAPYKYPRSIEFRDALPKTATGKLQRSGLKQPS
ncbi:MAG: AMP-binding protein [Hyphomonadaceae bacterium]|nr:AMP-binding protein [Hyphomonadaceae bacterium]